MRLRRALAVLSASLAVVGIAVVGCSSSSDDGPAMMMGGATLIGVSGGQLTSADGQVSIVVPAGAVGADTIFSVFPVASPPAGTVGSAYDLEPSGLVFAEPVTLTFQDDLADSTAVDLVIATYAGGAWSAVPSTVSVSAGTVSAPVMHFSLWGLIPAVSAGGDAGPKDGGSSLPTNS
jgi:hypothetical protein